MLELYTHPDTGTYALINPEAALKDPATGEWRPAVIYIGFDGLARVTIPERWAERFTRQDPQPSSKPWMQHIVKLLRHFPENPATPAHLRPNAMMVAAADRIEALETLLRQAHMWMTLLVDLADIDPAVTEVKVRVSDREDPVSTLSVSKTMDDIAALFGGNLPASAMMTEATTDPDHIEIEH